MRLLHIADLHLDRSFEGITDFPNWLQPIVDSANVLVWEKLVQLAIDKQVDVLLLAGDTFHQTQASLKMQQIFFAGLNRLADSDIPVVMCFGNHDYYRPDMFWFPFPDNVTVFTHENVETKTLQLANSETVAISGFSYTGPWIKEHKALEFPERAAADYHIGLYHGELGKENQYAPFQVAELLAKSYDYWALGHIHKGERVIERGCYAGTPQGHSRKEENGTGALVVDLTPGSIAIERIDTSEIIWKHLNISLLSVTSVQNLPGFLMAQLPVDSAQQQLLTIEFTDYQHLGEEFIHKITDGELLTLFQQEAAALSNNKIFLVQIELSQALKPEAKNLIPEELLEQSLATYRNTEVFKETLQDLLTQPEIARILDLEDFQEQVLSATEKLISSRLDI